MKTKLRHQILLILNNKYNQNEQRHLTHPAGSTRCVWASRCYFSLKFKIYIYKPLAHIYTKLHTHFTNTTHTSLGIMSFGNAVRRDASVLHVQVTEGHYNIRAVPNFSLNPSQTFKRFTQYCVFYANFSRNEFTYTTHEYKCCSQPIS